MGESPTRLGQKGNIFTNRRFCAQAGLVRTYPGILWVRPLVEVPATTRPLLSIAIIPMVSWFVSLISLAENVD